MKPDDNNSATNIPLYGLVGFPLGHSFSEAFFAEKFRRERINAEYRNFEIADVSELTTILSSTPALRGFNVTIPYKQQVMPLLNEIDAVAAEVGAVNVVKVSRDGDWKPTLRGYNSDVVGFEQSLKPLLKPWHKRALILGTGGASKAVAFVLGKLGIDYVKVSRTAAPGHLVYSDLSAEIMAEYTLIVNTTPLGMSPKVEVCPDLPYEYMTTRHLCYDLIYNPATTMFLRLSSAQGAAIKNGLEMLELQALESWRIWNK